MEHDKTKRWISKKLLLPLWHRTSSTCMCSKTLRILCVLLGWLLACGVGAVLWRGSLKSLEDEFYLKCENRKEILKSELENNLNASFVIIGLVASLPGLNETIWQKFTLQTISLRPNVKRLVYMERVVHSDRPAFERKWNGSISYRESNATFPRGNDTEYTPILFGPSDIPYRLLDPSYYPVLKFAIHAARDTGLFTLSPAAGGPSSWQMGAYLAYYGSGREGSSFTSVEERRQACLGYVGTVVNISEIFSRVLSRFAHAVEMDMVVVYLADPSARGDFDYNCSTTETTCAVALFDPAQKTVNASAVAQVQWSYGTQQFALRCIPIHNLKLLALRDIIAWPLFLSLVVIFFSIIVFLVRKRMQAIERDVRVIEKMNIDLKAAKVAAEAADKAKSNFLATVSHEIRTPMNGVIGMTNLLMGTNLTSQQLDYVKVAQASGNALIALINDVLDLSKIEAGKMELESVPFNLRKELDSVFTLFDDKLHQRKLEVFMLVHETVPNCVVGDPGRFRQILVNLINNALKFTKEGSILVSVRVMNPCSERDHNVLSSESVNVVSSAPKAQESIQLSQVLPNASFGLASSKFLRGGVFRRDEADLARGNTPPRLSMHSGDVGNTIEAVEAWRAWKFTTMSGRNCKTPKNFKVIVSVEDTGSGIPRHLQDRLFQPFSQGDSSSSREYGGTGIGLSICQKLIHLMRGALTVKSNPGEGNVLEFTLPLSVPETTDDNLRSCAKISMTEMTKLKGMRVALVDNNVVRQEVTASYLRCLGIDIGVFSEDAASTLNFLRDQNSKVHAVMVDLKGLLHESAVELASSIRQVPSWKTLPVLALSNAFRPADENELKGAGFSHIIYKPLRYNKLASVLLETVGVPARAPMKRMNVDSNMMSGKRVLVVDDNMVNRRVASSMLSRYGATVTIVNGGLEAVTAVKSQKRGEEFDLVLMDIQMPEVDGWEATRRIRQWEMETCSLCQNTCQKFCSHHRLPIVAVTADVIVKTRSMCFTSGMDDYITKPLDQKQLHSLLERFLKNDLVNAPLATKTGEPSGCGTPHLF